ncbi:MAG: esterase family protein [Oscillospiraceae bacterium]|jgi:putative tributyrin esterase|nr:esterase family protein [Oscillospiraceae bacterium]
MALMHIDFFSNVLGMSMNMDVIIPQETQGQIGMEGKGYARLKTLYLLHGMSDDHTIWQRRTSIERYVSGMPLAVVMPSTHLGWYTDMKHGLNYWTFISKELPGICRGFFPQLSDKREDTYAAGLSMGGYGALKCGLLAPETFGACASLSGAADMAPSAGQHEANPLFRNVFGDPESIRGTDNDLLAVAERLTDKSTRPRVYMWCGTEDFLIEANHAMRDCLTALGYDLTYEESPGDHQWKYWDEKIQRVLEWLDIPSQPTGFR